MLRSRTGEDSKSLYENKCAPRGVQIFAVQIVNKSAQNQFQKYFLSCNLSLEVFYIDDQTAKSPCLKKKRYYLIIFMSLLCCVFDSFYPTGAVVCYGRVTVTNCHTVKHPITYLSGKCASSNSSTGLWVLRETRSCLDAVIPEAVLFCFGNSPVCFEVSLFCSPSAPSSSMQCISAACEHKGLFGGWNSSS